MTQIASEDIRAAVASGVISEAQAAKLEILAEARHGYRAHMTDEDEPFELFRGFSEIFVTVGLVILFAGMLAMLVPLYALGSITILPVVAAGLAWLGAEYFTRRRRMALPSSFLSIAFGVSILILSGLSQNIEAAALSAVVFEPQRELLPQRILMVFALALVGMIIWYLRFRIPFSMLVMGIMGLGVVFSLASFFDPSLLNNITSPVAMLFDLGGNSNAALATLAFGTLTFVIAMGFDLRDPHRISRLSRAAFWLHVLAAPAIVNTMAFTTWSLGGQMGLILTALTLAIFTLLAIIIDRRSFLTAGLIYFAFVLNSVVDGGSSTWTSIYTLLVLGGAVTLVGTFWTQIRTGLMKALPNFPLKRRLPPYAEAL